MEYLTDSEIIDWNGVITDTNFYASPVYNNRNSYPSIKFNKLSHLYGDDKVIINMEDPIISYDIFFSILESGKDIFSKIRNSVFSIILKNEVLNKDNTYQNIDISSLEIDEREDLFLFKGKKYINLRFILKGNTSAIMAYYSLIKRCINFYQKSWGVEQKEEKLLLPFKIGDIVTCIDNNIDMIIIDYTYSVYMNRIEYITREIVDKNSYILYSKENIYSNDRIVLSRNNKLEILLED